VRGARIKIGGERAFELAGDQARAEFGRTHGSGIGAARVGEEPLHGRHQSLKRRRGMHRGRAPAQRGSQSAVEVEMEPGDAPGAAA